MASFIDLYSSDRWSEHDIKTRLHAILRSQVSQELEDETIRAGLGASLKQHTLTPEEYANILKFKAVTDDLAITGAQSRADAALLNATLYVEAAFLRLRQPYEDTVEGMALQASDTAAVQAVSAEVLNLLNLRNPT